MTGASCGLGRACAVALGAAGARVVLNGRSDAVREAVAEIEAAGGVAAVSQRGVREGAQIVADALDAFGRLDALVHNAGVVADRSFLRMSDNDWSDGLDVNLNGGRGGSTRCRWGDLNSPDGRGA